MNYYNEIDPYVAQWLRNLIAAGHIPFGYVDERSIEDVTPADLAGYTQCHFFAGIAGWPRALQLAGWPDDRQVWTASCPCQPFSAAGQSAGFADERHLWPAFFHLAEQCRPAVILGEQVASKAVDAWVDLVHADLEGVDYRFASVPYPAAGVGAPHIRDRNLWVADTHGTIAQLAARQGSVPDQAQVPGPHSEPDGRCDAGGLGHTDHARLEGFGDGYSAAQRQRAGSAGPAAAPGEPGGLADGGRSGPTNGFWGAADWLLCRDGKWRPVESGTFPLAHGIPGRVGRLRAYGNAIVPPAVAEFIKAYLECQP